MDYIYECDYCGPTTQNPYVKVCVNNHFICGRCLENVFEKELKNCLICKGKILVYKDLFNRLFGNGKKKIPVIYDWLKNKI